MIEKALKIVMNPSITVEGETHNLIPTDRIILAHILFELEKQSPMTAKLVDIAEKIGMEHKAVGRAVRNLKSIGAITAEKRKEWIYHSVNVD